MGRRKIVITCEHASHYIPKAYSHLFVGGEDIVKTHRGWDPGAFTIAKFLAKHLEAPLFIHKPNRLLIEVNRSIGHKQLFSEFSEKLSESVKNELITTYYRPYRDEVEAKISRLVGEGNEVLHLSVHSFTPIVNGIERSVDIGILFDDNRANELGFSSIWKAMLQELLPELTVMFNCPYQGADDGFTTYLRTRFLDHQYMGIELEVNQKYVETPVFKEIEKALVNSLSKLANNDEPELV